MNFLDIFAVFVLAYGAYKGFKNGVLIEVAGLLGLIIGFWAGMRLAFIFAHYYKDNFHIPEKWVPAIAFFTAFAIGLGAVYLAGWAATKILNTAQLELPNKLAGMGFAILKWGFLLGAFFSIIGNSEILSEETVANSATYPVVTSYSRVVQEYTIGLLPAARNVLDEMEDYFVDLDSANRDSVVLPSDSLIVPADSSSGFPDRP